VRPPRITTQTLGKLEARLMTILWRGNACSVRDVVQALRGELAYTTVMTTLDRLHTKGLLGREKVGNAFSYRAVVTRAEFERHIVEHAVTGMLRRSGEPVLTAFIAAAADVDEANLARLEALIAARRKVRR